MKRKALKELLAYEKALKECYTDRCHSLAEGVLAGFCVIGLLSKKEGADWQERFNKLRRVWLDQRAVS